MVLKMTSSSVNSSNEDTKIPSRLLLNVTLRKAIRAVKYLTDIHPDELIYSNPTMSDWRVHTGIDFLADEGAASLCP